MMTDPARTAGYAGGGIAVTRSLPAGCPPVLLIHGLGSTATATWGDTGWFVELERAGFGWLAPDLRGHGGSIKPHQPDSYRPERLVADAVAVLDDAGITTVDVVGYSLGARIAIELAADRPDRVGRLVLGGFGDGAGSAPPVQQLLDHLAAGADRAAVAACAAGAATEASPPRIADVGAPVLLVAGDADTFAGSIESLAERLVDARTERVAGRNHFTTLSATSFKRTALDFLAARR